MKYLTSTEISLIWGVSDRSVRNYCSNGRVIGAYLDGKVWMIPENAMKPERKIRHSKNSKTLLEILKDECSSHLKGGIYHKLQIEMTYNSNHIEGSKLTHDQTRYIFETKTIGEIDSSIKIDDILETINHFSCIELVIEMAQRRITEAFIKQLHYILKSGTTDSKKSWFKVGDYKMLENGVGGMETTPPKLVSSEMKKLLLWYNGLETITVNEIVEFHQRFEEIHPFQDGNGRIGRLIMFKECLKNNITPIIITDNLKLYYYRGLKEWKHNNGYLIDTCLTGQDIVDEYLKDFNIR